MTNPRCVGFNFPLSPSTSIHDNDFDYSPAVQLVRSPRLGRKSVIIRVLLAACACTPESLTVARYPHLPCPCLSMPVGAVVHLTQEYRVHSPKHIIPRVVFKSKRDKWCTLSVLRSSPRLSVRSYVRTCAAHCFLLSSLLRGDHTARNLSIPSFAADLLCWCLGLGLGGSSLHGCMHYIGQDN